MRFLRYKWRFIRSLVEDAPDNPGVYALWEGDKLICFGRAEGDGETLRSRLIDHLEGRTGEEARHATHYSWEICLDPRRREAEIMRELAAHSQEGSSAAPQPRPDAPSVH